MSDDPFVLAGVELPSRLIMGTGGAPNLAVLEDRRQVTRRDVEEALSLVTYA